MSIALAIKYRPQTFEDVVEQGATTEILQSQIRNDNIKNSYLFCGGAGTGKTTCARIFAKEINKFKGNAIELDAASNNSVNDVRAIIDQAQNKSLDSEYKVFILDECHALSNAGWQAFLKIIEEPPAKSVFIFCTTDPQKIPKTILSRVQRFDFQRISSEGIVKRLKYICEQEKVNVSDDVIDYIARRADGGMRDAITTLDKCLAYSTTLTITDVFNILGVIDYSTNINLTDFLITGNMERVIKTIESVYNSGYDLKQFISQYLDFILDVCKYRTCGDISITRLPETVEVKTFLGSINDTTIIHSILDMIVKLDTDIKYSLQPKVYIEAIILSWIYKEDMIK